MSRLALHVFKKAHGVERPGLGGGGGNTGGGSRVPGVARAATACLPVAVERNHAYG